MSVTPTKKENLPIAGQQEERVGARLGCGGSNADSYRRLSQPTTTSPWPPYISTPYLIEELLWDLNTYHSNTYVWARKTSMLYF